MSQPASIRHLEDYIAIPSVNPMGRDDLSPEVAGERRYAEHLHHQLGQLKIDSQVIGEGDRASVVANITTASASETFMVASHLDTVPIDSMTIDPFDPVIKSGRLYGRGACDTKAGMASLLEALERVLSRGSLKRNLVLVGEADEEFTSIGVSDVVAHLDKGQPDWVLATEPTDLQLITHHKGVVFARLAAQGRACHASDPQLGSNAVVKLSGAVLALDELSREIQKRSDPALGPATLSVGVFHGGQSPNIVPDRAWLVIDRRLLPGESAAQVQAELRAALSTAGISDVEVESCIEAKPPLATSPEDPSVRACRAALTAMQLPSDPGSVAFGTDAGLFAQHGVPGVVMGPGSIRQAHTDTEYVEIAQVEAMTEIYVKLLEGETP